MGSTKVAVRLAALALLLEHAAFGETRGETRGETGMVGVCVPTGGMRPCGACCGNAANVCAVAWGPCAVAWGPWDR